MIPQYNINGLGGEYKKTEELELKLAEFLGVKYVVMASSGTAALAMSYSALGKPIVRVPALTMIATANAGKLIGSDVLFYDIDAEKDETSTLVSVALNGRDPGVDADIEDACQALGSKDADGRYIGTRSKIGCFSFSPQKIITSGAGGCAVTNDKDLADNMRKLKNFGRLSGGDVHDEMGFNFKFTDIQAEVLLSQFKTINNRIQAKKDIYNEYQKYLGGYMLEHTGTPWFVDIYVDDPDMLSAALLLEGIRTRTMYPIVPAQKPYLEEGLENKYPHSMYFSTRGLWLPSSPDLTKAQIRFISDMVLKHV